MEVGASGGSLVFIVRVQLLNWGVTAVLKERTGEERKVVFKSRHFKLSLMK